MIYANLILVCFFTTKVVIPFLCRERVDESDFGTGLHLRPFYVNRVPRVVTFNRIYLGADVIGKQILVERNYDMPI